MRAPGVTERADAIAREMVAQIGRWPAIGYMLGRVVGAGSWSRLRQGLRLLAAIVRVA